MIVVYVRVYGQVGCRGGIFNLWVALLDVAGLWSLGWHVTGLLGVDKVDRGLHGMRVFSLEARGGEYGGCSGGLQGSLLYYGVLVLWMS